MWIMKHLTVLTLLKLPENSVVLLRNYSMLISIARIRHHYGISMRIYFIIKIGTFLVHGECAIKGLLID